MFASLVDPVIEGLMDCMKGIERDYSGELETIDPANAWKDQSEPVKAMAYIYEHFDEFKLTRCEHFTHDPELIEQCCDYELCIKNGRVAYMEYS